MRIARRINVRGFIGMIAIEAMPSDDAPPGSAGQRDATLGQTLQRLAAQGVRPQSNRWAGQEVNLRCSRLGQQRARLASAAGYMNADLAGLERQLGCAWSELAIRAHDPQD